MLRSGGACVRHCASANGQRLAKRQPSGMAVAAGTMPSMAASRARQLIRTTLYVVSPALKAPGNARSKLYSASHNHLFRGGAE